MTSTINHAETCKGCLRPKNDDDEVQCSRCATEMCDACFSISPVEGDEDAYCKRCAQERLDEEEEEDDTLVDEENYGANGYYFLCEVCNVIAPFKREDDEGWAMYYCAEHKHMGKEPEDE